MADPNQFTLRVSDDGRKWVHETMGILDVPQATVIRALFSVGTRHPQEVIEYIKKANEKTSDVGALPEATK